MRPSRFAAIVRSRRALLGAAWVGIVCASACVNGAEVPESDVGPMPEHAEWRGVYRSGQGYLHLARSGSHIVGAWRVPPGLMYGRLAGEAQGNRLSYEWVEYGAKGEHPTRSGHGYFIYSADASGSPTRLLGERGLGDEDRGQLWTATKQADIRPNLAFAIPGTDGDGKVAAGYVDDDSQYYVDSAEDQP